MTAGGDLDPVASFRLEGQVAIVTGASSGPGSRFARVLVAAGAAVVATARRADVLVNNAGMSYTGAAEDEPVDTFRTVLDVNLLAPFVLAQGVARHALAHRERASIINVASVLGMVGLGRIPQAGYAASKGGLVNLTRELSAQWARKGVRVNALAPGWFESEMTSLASGASSYVTGQVLAVDGGWTAV